MDSNNVIKPTVFEIRYMYVHNNSLAVHPDLPSYVATLTQVDLWHSSLAITTSSGSTRVEL